MSDIALVAISFCGCLLGGSAVCALVLAVLFLLPGVVADDPGDDV